jgi:hypothetical protein
VYPNGHSTSQTPGKHKHNATHISTLRNAIVIYKPFPCINLFKRMPINSLPHTWTLMTLSATTPTAQLSELLFMIFYTQRLISENTAQYCDEKKLFFSGKVCPLSYCFGFLEKDDSAQLKVR